MPIIFRMHTEVKSVKVAIMTVNVEVTILR